MISIGSSVAGEKWTQLGSAIGGLMVLYAMFQQHFPPYIRSFLNKKTQKLIGYFYPFITITFQEYAGKRMERSELYTDIENYLTTKSSTRATRLRADAVKNSSSVTLSMADNQEVTDEYQGATLWWTSIHRVHKTQSFSFYPASDEKRFYSLTFHRQHRELITTSYLAHVMEKGKEISVKNRQRKLYTNSSGDERGFYRSRLWSHVVFEHPASFRTLGMDPKKKQEIVDDLITFSNAKDYYAEIGKAWKRGYLLYGPPGTGKSTMIAAMANLLGYDVYDLELTAVKDNAQLRQLLIETSGKSIIVIEDIDCSLELTGQRKEKDNKNDGKEKDTIKKELEKEKKGSKVTLSGLLNFIDGLWSACGSERLIVFTTNYLEKLDPALIRRGRMDKHIELSYCTFEAFKILAMNYHRIESHKLFDDIGKALAETNISPADVAESLMPKCREDDVDACLENLLDAIRLAREEAIIKAKEEAKVKDEEAKKKEQEAVEKATKEAAEANKGKEVEHKEVKENALKAEKGTSALP